MSGRLFYYEHFVEGRRVYVGITNNASARRDEHAETKAYFVKPVTIEVYPFAPGTSRVQARAYERAQINRLRPPFNVAGNPDYKRQGQERAEICSGHVGALDRVDHMALWFTDLARRAVLVLGGVVLGVLVSALVVAL